MLGLNHGYGITASVTNSILDEPDFKEIVLTLSSDIAYPSFPNFNHCIWIVPKVERVIFNHPATIIFWKDGSKTVVKCQQGDTYDKEKGFVMAYLKKLLGNKNEFNKEINKWVYGE